MGPAARAQEPVSYTHLDVYKRQVLGGGFNSNPAGRFWETVFDLPLTVPQDRRQWFRPLFLDARGQPAFHGGVAVNAALQPVDATGDAVYANLWAAGALLAHADPILERSLEGVAIASGVTAAEAICSRDAATIQAG